MKEFFGYLLLIGIITLIWGSSFAFYNQGDMMGAAVTFGIGSIFALLFVYSVYYTINVHRRNNLVAEDYEVVMTQFYRVEDHGHDWYVVHSIWIDPEGDQYTFQSEMMKYNPEFILRGKEIPVKISRKNRALYTMDLSFLPKLA